MRSGTIYFSPGSDIQEITSEITFDANPSSPERDLYQIQPRLFSSELSCTSRDEDNIDQTTTINIRNSKSSVEKIDGVDIGGDLDEQLRTSLAYDVLLDESSLAEVREDYNTATPIGCYLKHFFPIDIYYKIDSIHEEARNLVLALQNDDRRTFRLRRLLAKDIILSHKVVKILKDVLNNVSDSNNILKNMQQNSILNSDKGAISYRLWHNSLRTMHSKDRVKILMNLRECDDLFERIHKAMINSNDSQEIKYSIVQERSPQRIIEASRYLDNFFQIL